MRTGWNTSTKNTESISLVYRIWKTTACGDTASRNNNKQPQRQWQGSWRGSRSRRRRLARALSWNYFGIWYWPQIFYEAGRKKKKPKAINCWQKTWKARQGRVEGEQGSRWGRAGHLLYWSTKRKVADALWRRRCLLILRRALFMANF